MSNSTLVFDIAIGYLLGSVLRAGVVTLLSFYVKQRAVKRARAYLGGLEAKLEELKGRGKDAH